MRAVRLVWGAVYPTAKCLGDGYPKAEGEKECEFAIETPDRECLAKVKDHVKQNPEHEVEVIQENISRYGAR